MTMTSEERKKLVIDILEAAYPGGRTRADVVAIIPEVKPTQVDNVLFALCRLPGYLAKDNGVYTLRTAPESYNARLLAERNADGEQAPEAVKVSPMDEKPMDVNLRKKVVTEYGGRVPDNPSPMGSTRAPICPEPLPACAANPEICPNCEGLILNGHCMNEYCGQETISAPTDFDPIAVRKALEDLNASLTVDRVDMALKLEVLEYLGRILDDSIETVLVSIAEDLKR